MNSTMDIAAPSVDVSIRCLTEADIAAADDVLKSAFGTPESHIADIGRYIALQPEGWLVAIAQGLPVGMVGAVDYGPFAWIGLMAVHTRAQRRGIGAALMQRLLAQLDARGTPVALLDATEAGAALYRLFGFVEDDQTYKFQHPGYRRSTCWPAGVRLVQPEDVSALVEFDTPIFGANRARVLCALLTEFPGRAFLVENETGQIAGYLFAQPRRLGPWVAERPQAGEALLQAALALPYEGGPLVVVPGLNATAIEQLERCGFQLVSSHRHMRRGGATLPSRRAAIYGQASFAIG
jgi:predicted N-acetyltransferase YhbS